MNTARALLYARTLPTLRPVQVLGRVWRTLHRPRPDLRPAPPLRAACFWRAPGLRAQALVGPSRLRFLGREGDVRSAGDWNAPGRERLWTYNLHYFEWLDAPDAERRDDWGRALVARWVRENPPGEGAGWEPYPLSLRVASLVRWAAAGNELPREMVESLAVQARYLRASLEHHLLGNHLFANAKALVFAGAFFAGDEAAGWLAKGLALLRREIGEQILEDGGHFERSPMYHALLLADLLDLLGLARAYPSAIGDADERLWRATAERMRRWLAVMTHPDGDIPFFNDAAFGVAPRAAALDAYAQRLGLEPAAAPEDGLHHLASSGYVRLQRGPAVALVDVAEIGPRYLPGHAHADTLGFELSLFGRRALVQSGTSSYEPGPERLRQRSTEAHNTVVVDGADSSEVWASFRVARRAMPVDLVLEEQGDELVVGCAHDGYLRLPGRVMHRRTWRLGERGLHVSDRIGGSFTSAAALLYLHPHVCAEAGGARLLLEGDRHVALAAAGGRCTVEPATWHPELGSAVETSRLRIELRAERLDTRLRW